MKLIDLHCDTIYRIMKDKSEQGIRKNDYSIDIDKLQNADSIAQFFAMFIDLQNCSDPLDHCLHMLNIFYRELEINNNSIAIARSFDELNNNLNSGKLSAFLTIEEGAVLKGKIDNLLKLYDMGVRLITLTWNYPNEIGYPNAGWKYFDQGLTDFGKELVYAMNDLGTIIDVSHLSDKGFYDVASISSRPFVASHSNSRAITKHPRNLSDDMIKILADNGGVMGINFESSFLGEGNSGRVSDMIEHIKYIKKVGGIDVIALGSDFDGISHLPEIENIGEIEKLSNELIRNNFKENEIEKIFYKNALRVIKDSL